MASSRLKTASGECPPCSFRAVGSPPCRKRPRLESLRLLATCVLFVTIVVCATPATAGPTTDARLDALLGYLASRGYAVQETLRGDPRVVLVLSDAHLPEVAGATLGELDTLRGTFPFDVVGLEGADHDFLNLRVEGGPPTPLRVSVESTLAAVSPAFRDWAFGVLEQRVTPGVTALQRKYVDGHRDVAIGLEGRGVSNLRRLLLGAVSAALVGDRVDALDGKTHPFDPASELHRERLRGIAVLDSVLAREDPGFPRWPATFAGTDTSRATLMRYYNQLTYWLHYSILVRRNQIFSVGLTTELAHRGGHAAVAIVGLAHTRPSREGPSLPEMLHYRGATVVVADPPAVCRYRATHPEHARAME